jgi:hypothetical protein
MTLCPRPSHEQQRRQRVANRKCFPKRPYLSLTVLCGDWPSWLSRENSVYRSTSVQLPHLEEC